MYSRSFRETDFSLVTYTRETSVDVFRSVVCPDTLDLLGQLILHQHLVFDKAIYHFGLVQDIVYDYISEEIVDES